MPHIKVNVGTGEQYISAPTPEQKLAASGLTVDELKSLLGIQ